jgi:hypothetical protein
MRVSTTSGRADVEQVEQSAIEWLRTELDDPEISGADNFLDIGGHSLVFSRLNKFLADSFGVVLDQKTTYSDPLSAAVAAVRPFGK